MNGSISQAQKGSTAMQNIPVVHPDLNAMIADTRKIAGEGKIFAYEPFQGRYAPNWSIGVATLGEAGYIPAPINIHFPTYDQASDFCGDLHCQLGFDANTATVIVMDTMRRSELNREQESDTISVKMNAERIEHALEAVREFYSMVYNSDVEEVLQEAKDALDERLGSTSAFHR